MKDFFKRLSTAPYESAAAILVAWVGIGSFFDPPVSQQIFIAALPAALSVWFNAANVIAGVALVIGLGLGYRNLEMFGLILLVGSLLVRVVVLVNYTGFGPVVNGAIIQFAVYIIASLVRLSTLARNRVVLMVDMDDVFTGKDLEHG